MVEKAMLEMVERLVLLAVLFGEMQPKLVKPPALVPSRGRCQHTPGSWLRRPRARFSMELT